MINTYVWLAYGPTVNGLATCEKRVCEKGVNSINAEVIPLLYE